MIEMVHDRLIVVNNNKPQNCCDWLIVLEQKPCSRTCNFFSFCQCFRLFLGLWWMKTTPKVRTRPDVDCRPIRSAKAQTFMGLQIIQEMGICAVLPLAVRECHWNWAHMALMPFHPAYTLHSASISFPLEFQVIIYKYVFSISLKAS